MPASCVLIKLEAQALFQWPTTHALLKVNDDNHPPLTFPTQNNMAKISFSRAINEEQTIVPFLASAKLDSIS